MDNLLYHTVVGAATLVRVRHDLCSRSVRIAVGCPRQWVAVGPCLADAQAAKQPLYHLPRRCQVLPLEPIGLKHTAHRTEIELPRLVDEACAAEHALLILVLEACGCRGARRLSTNLCG